MNQPAPVNWPSIGIIGGGQLARMLTLYGSHLGVNFYIYNDLSKVSLPFCGKELSCLEELIEKSDYITFEHEHVSFAHQLKLTDYKKLCPSHSCLQIFQDRLKEKEFLQSLGILTAPYKAVPSKDHIPSLVSHFDRCCFLKKRIGGYDGKHQIEITSTEDLNTKYNDISTITNNSWVIEKKIDFTREVSLISACTSGNKISFFPMTENKHQGGILRSSNVMRNYYLQEAAEAISQKITVSLSYRGVMCIEFFEYMGKLYVNEIAPRVHNSGHWTIEGLHCNQFEAHCRGVLGLPIPKTHIPRNTYIRMLNCIGALPDKKRVLDSTQDQVAVHLHDYQKEGKEGRKVGHITVCSNNKKKFTETTEQIASLLK